MRRVRHLRQRRQIYGLAYRRGTNPHRWERPHLHPGMQVWISHSYRSSPHSKETCEHMTNIFVYYNLKFIKGHISVGVTKQRSPKTGLACNGQ